MNVAEIEFEEPKIKDEKIIEYKKRMLAWSNPVEFVNNMYGSHPDDDDDDKDGPDYFQKVFSE